MLLKIKNLTENKIKISDIGRVVPPNGERDIDPATFYDWSKSSLGGELESLINNDILIVRENGTQLTKEESLKVLRTYYGKDEKSKVSENDSVTGYLLDKLLAGTNVTITEINDGGEESLRIDAIVEESPISTSVFDAYDSVGGLTINQGLDTDIPLDTEINKSPDYTHSTTVNNEELTFNTNGTYIILATVGISGSNNTGKALFQVHADTGSGFVPLPGVCSAGGKADTESSTTLVMSYNASSGDKIKIVATSVSNTVTTAPNQSGLTVTSIRGATGQTGPIGPQGPQGISGTDGDNGTNGTDGVDGDSWIVQSSDPTSGQGKDGDLALNRISCDVFQKISGNWTYQGNIKGDQGIQGNKGDQGDQGLTGPVGPEGPQGIPGEGNASVDYFPYFNTDTIVIQHYYGKPHNEAVFTTGFGVSDCHEFGEEEFGEKEFGIGITFFGIPVKLIYDADYSISYDSNFNITTITLGSINTGIIQLTRG